MHTVLWQARLPQELRLAGAGSLEEANRYIREVFLPWHNAHRTLSARESGTAFVPAGGADLEGILCLQAERVVANDNTVAFGRMRLQLAPVAWRCSFAQCRVKVCEHLDGRLSIRLGPRVLGWIGNAMLRVSGNPDPLSFRTISIGEGYHALVKKSISLGKYSIGENPIVSYVNHIKK